MLYVFEQDGNVYVSSLDPDTEDLETVMNNAFIAKVPYPTPLAPSIQANIVRNVLISGIDNTPHVVVC